MLMHQRCSRLEIPFSYAPCNPARVPWQRGDLIVPGHPPSAGLGEGEHHPPPKAHFGPWDACGSTLRVEFFNDLAPELQWPFSAIRPIIESCT